MAGEIARIIKRRKVASKTHLIGRSFVLFVCSELPVDPKFRAQTRIRAKWAKLSEKGPKFGILAGFLKNGDIFFFNNNKAIAKITFKDDL